MAIGAQVVVRNILGNTVHSKAGSEGTNPLYPAMNAVQAYEIVEKDYGEHPAFRIAKDGKLQVIQVEPVEAEFVEPIRRRL